MSTTAMAAAKLQGEPTNSDARRANLRNDSFMDAKRPQRQCHQQTADPQGRPEKVIRLFPACVLRLPTDGLLQRERDAAAVPSGGRPAILLLLPATVISRARSTPADSVRARQGRAARDRGGSLRDLRAQQSN